MRVLITGGAGHIGRAIAECLLQKGWDVRIVDLAPEPDIPDVEYTVCDILDYDGLYRQMDGCQAVVHMAALRSPTMAPGQDVFRINVAGTYNLFEAAARAGIQRVVQASSINAIGCAWNLTDFSPQYLPVDENHPRSTNDPYSFSKQIVEDIGDYYWRRDGIVSVAMRYPAVHAPDFRESDRSVAYRQMMVAMLDELQAQPEAERQKRLAEARQKALEFRNTRPLEYDPERSTNPFRADNDDMLWRAYTFDRFNLWAYVDVRDAANAVEKALTAKLDGSHALFVNADRNSLGYDSQSLAQLFFPETPIQQALAGASSLVSIGLARNLIGFEPEYS